MATLEARHKERRIELRRSDDGLPKSCQQWIEEGVVKGVQQGVEAGLKAVFADEEFCRSFWEHGHTIFVAKTTTGVHLWFGKKALQWALGMAMAALGILAVWLLSIKYGVKVS